MRRQLKAVKERVLADLLRKMEKNVYSFERFAKENPFGFDG